ncbi:MAG: hypothetical protein IPO37_04685 [Saprospiraceae bacterium]|nr:hypothetical protein [Saprospiraceae bacterium]
MKFFILPLSKGKLYFNGTSLIKSIILFILFSSTINSTVIAQSPCTSPLGAVPSLTCPKVAQFQILQGSSCDIDQAVPGIKFGCATTLGNLRRTNGNTTCECNDNAACVGEWDTSESSNWSGNRQVYFDINFDPTKTVSFGQLLIQAITGPNIGGTGQNNNYPRKLAIKVYQNGNEIYTTNNITMSTTTWSYSTIDLTSLQNLPGNATYRIGIVAYDLNSGTGMAAQEFKDIQLSACCSDACDPDNPNAPPFCAPTPTCAAGSFLWTQAINQTDGSSSLRMFCGSTTSYTIPGPYPAAYNSGVSINVSDVVSYDGYASRNTVTQANERWRIVFKKNGIVQASTGYTNDVPDLRNQGYWRGSLGTVILPSGTDQIVIEHWSVANDGSCGNGPNSVAPTSICLQHTVLNSTSCNPVLPNLCAANILKAYNIIDPGTFVTQVHGRMIDIFLVTTMVHSKLSLAQLHF